MIDTVYSRSLAPLLWQGLLAVHASTVHYTPRNTQAAEVDLTVIWKEGSGDETVSPGRYSHIWVQVADLAPGVPVKGDAVTGPDGKVYNVETVIARIDGYARLVLKEKP